MEPIRDADSQVCQGFANNSLGGPGGPNPAGSQAEMPRARGHECHTRGHRQEG
jgi:hypothetical protein